MHNQAWRGSGSQELLTWLICLGYHMYLEISGWKFINWSGIKNMIFLLKLNASSMLECLKTLLSFYKYTGPSLFLCMCASSLQSWRTLCDPMDYSPPSSSVHGILQARILEWVALPSSKGSSNSGIEPMSLMSPALAGEFFTTGAT